MRPIKLIRNLGNKLGLAWWAKVETEAPDVIYWFGPFLTKKSLKGNLEIFIYSILEQKEKRITNSIGIDTEAEWHPSGSDRRPTDYVCGVKCAAPSDRDSAAESWLSCPV